MIDFEVDKKFAVVYYQVSKILALPRVFYKPDDKLNARFFKHYSKIESHCLSVIIFKHMTTKYIACKPEVLILIHTSQLVSPWVLYSAVTVFPIMVLDKQWVKGTIKRNNVLVWTAITNDFSIILYTDNLREKTDNGRQKCLLSHSSLMLCSQTWLKSLSGLSYMALGLFEKTFKQFVYWSGFLMQI